MGRPERLRGRVVFVTGAGSGIGAASARALHRQGARLVLVDMNEAPVRRLADELGGEAHAIAVAANVTERDTLDAAVSRGVAAFGGIDIVFANAGISAEPPATVRTMPDAMFERVVAVDTLGVYRTVRACLDQVVARRGYVLVTSSIYAFVNGMCNTPYAMSKAAVEMFARSLRAELANTGAKAGVLYPGWVRTPIAASALGGHAIAAELVRLGFPAPLRQAIEPETVADAVVRGMGYRSARIVCPGRWNTVSALRGVVSPLSDLVIEHHPKMRALVRRMEAEAPLG